MSKQNAYVNLENLGKGAAAEMFQSELERVIANIHDPNTKADAVRGVTLKVKIKPDKNRRDFASVEISCDGKLAAIMPYETSLYTGMDNGKGVATEFNPDQGHLTVTSEEGEQVDVKTGQVVGKIGAAR